MAKQVRMADIAERLNISVVSVSKALSGKRGVSEEMRARVPALAGEMGYEGTKPAKAASNIGSIGVLAADRCFTGSAFYSSLYRFLILKAREAGYTCIVEIISRTRSGSSACPC